MTQKYQIYISPSALGGGAAPSPPTPLIRILLVILFPFLIKNLHVLSVYADAVYFLVTQIHYVSIVSDRHAGEVLRPPPNPPPAFFEIMAMYPNQTLDVSSCFLPFCIEISSLFQSNHVNVRSLSAQTDLTCLLSCYPDAICFYCLRPPWAETFIVLLFASFRESGWFIPNFPFFSSNNLSFSLVPGENFSIFAKLSCTISQCSIIPFFEVGGSLPLIHSPLRGLIFCTSFGNLFNHPSFFFHSLLLGDWTFHLKIVLHHP